MGGSNTKYSKEDEEAYKERLRNALNRGMAAPEPDKRTSRELNDAVPHTDILGLYYEFMILKFPLIWALLDKSQIYEIEYLKMRVVWPSS